MIGAGGYDSGSRYKGDNILRRDVLFSQRADRPAPDTPVLEDRFLAEGVFSVLPDGQGRLFLKLDNFRVEAENVAVQKRIFFTVRRFVSEQQQFTETQIIDEFRNRSVFHHIIGAGVAS